jgi:hypothetical protein
MRKAEKPFDGASCFLGIVLGSALGILVMGLSLEFAGLGNIVYGPSKSWVCTTLHRTNDVKEFPPEFECRQFTMEVTKP